MSAADRVKPITVYGQLFVPHVKIPFDIPPPGRTQRRISLSQNVPESLKYLQVTRFHVEQRPVEKPTPVFAALEECLQAFGRNHHDRKPPRQR